MNTLTDNTPSKTGKLQLTTYQDEVTVDTGNQEITVNLPGKPLRVWFSLGDDCCPPVCQGNVDKAGATLLDNGFVIYAEITSTMRIIKWFAIMEADNGLM